MLDDQSLGWLGWKARLRHYDLLVGSALMHEAMTHAERMVSGGGIPYRSAVPLLLYDLLNCIGAVDTEGRVTEPVRDRFDAALHTLSDAKDPVGCAAVAVLLQQVATLAPGLGVSAHLLDHGSELLMRLLEEAA